MPQDEFAFIDTEGLLERLENPRGALESIGAFLKSKSKESFVKKRFGGTTWKEQYPDQSSPFIHKAGAVADLKRGAVKSRRFSRGQPLRDRGLLFMGIDYNVVSKKKVVVGASRQTRKYAAIQLHGLESKQKIGEDVRENLSKALRSISRGLKSDDDKRSTKAKKKSGLQKLGFLFNVDELTTKVHARPFIGVTQEMRNKIPEIVSGEF